MLALHDIHGFFNNIYHDRLVANLGNLGYAPELVEWTCSFFKDSKVHLSFNNITSEEQCHDPMQTNFLFLPPHFLFTLL